MTVVLREEELKMNKSTKHGFRIIVAVLGMVALAGALFMQVNPAGASLAHLHAFNALQRLWKEVLQYIPAGTYYQELVLKHQEEVQTLLEQHPEHIATMWYVAELFAPGVDMLQDGKGDPVLTKKQIVSAPKRWDAPLMKIGSCEYPRCLYTAARRTSGDPHEPTDTDDSEN